MSGGATRCRRTSVRVYDPSLVPTSEPGTPQDLQDHPPVEDPPVKLGRGRTLGSLDEGLAELVINACTFRGHS